MDSRNHSQSLPPAFGRAMAELLPVGVFRSDSQGNYIWVNRRWCELAGVEAGAALGAGWKVSLHPDDMAGIVEAWKSAVEGGHRFEKQFRFWRWDGTVQRVRCRTLAEHDEQGPIIGFAGVVTETEAQNVPGSQTERELKESEERLALAMASTSDGLLDWNVQTGATYVNPQYYTMLGYKPGEFLAATRPSNNCAILTMRVPWRR